MKIGKFAVAIAAVAALTLTAGCSSDDNAPKAKGGDKTSSETSAPAGGASGQDGEFEAEMTNPDARPTVPALNQMLQRALDPDIPAAQKTNLVEGSEADPALFDELVKALEENPGVEYQITPPVLAAGPRKGTVKVEVGLPDTPPTRVDATIVFDDGRWKLSKSTVCPLLQANDVETPMCASDSAATTTARR